MKHIIIEIKARSEGNDTIRTLLETLNAEFIGIDHQIDTYFNCRNGRLKLREGNIERHLIHYERQNEKGPKKSDVILYKPNIDPNLKDILTRSLGVLVVVDKKREIFFVENVKVHLDEIESLGSFVEIEAIGGEDGCDEAKLRKQCEELIQIFSIQQDDLISESYSDLMMSKTGELL